MTYEEIQGNYKRAADIDLKEIESKMTERYKRDMVGNWHLCDETKECLQCHPKQGIATSNTTEYY